MTEVLTDTQPIRLKGRSFLALALSPELPFDNWLRRLDDLVTRSAGFFLNRPIVLDLAGLEIDGQQLRSLIDHFCARNIRILGIEGAQADLLGDDMPPAMSGGLQAAEFEAAAGEETGLQRLETGADASNPSKSLMITQPVRSGQLVVTEGDITVVGQVASGAEVVAGGSIHIYGALRGRAMAGSYGDQRARIFCRKFEAELVAINSTYLTSEDLDPGLRGRAVQLWLQNGEILAETLN